MAITRKRLTLEEFLRLPEAEPALEFEDGEVVQKVSPKGRHSALQTGVAELFNRFSQPRKLARAFTELRATYAGRSYEPDVALYRWDRVPVDDTGEIANEFREPPDVVVEVVSPEQSTNALVRRCLWYVEHGAGIALLIDPDDKSVLLFRPDRTTLALRGPDPIELGDVLPGFQLTAHDIFDTLRMR